jgi:hypothetical protein
VRLDRSASLDDGTGDSLGLYPRASFRVVRGEHADDATIPQARWYFAKETVAVPAAGLPVAQFSRGVRTQDDVRRWARERPVDASLAYPPLVWIAAPEVVRHAQLSADARRLAYGGNQRIGLELVPKHALNRSYFDPSSARFFARRRVKLRGARDGDRFVARTLWPEDFALAEAPPLRPLNAALPAQRALRELVREAPQGGARGPFDAWTLWRRDDRVRMRGGYVLALILTGAQGDDDEAHAGHFALATGRLDADGAIGDWLVDNFYALDSESEKGIIGAPVPLDNYLADLNAGQNWYRPAALFVAALRHARAAELVQGAINRVYNQFYRHQLHYDHAAMNCTGISVDTLRTLGLVIARRIPAWRPLAPLALPLLLATERSIAGARRAYDYATEDATRLLPAAAFEEIGASLIALAERSRAPRGELAALLADDTDALVFARIPQLPSSRVFGDAPVVELREYHARLPARRADMKIIPVPPRPFPAELREGDLLPAPWRRSSTAIALWLAIVVAAVTVALYLAS